MIARNPRDGRSLERHKAYEAFIMNDLVPAIRTDCNSSDIRIATIGTSLGAFYAANFALHDVSHDWIWWKRQGLLHLNQKFG